MKHTPWMAAAAISATSLLLAACGTSSSSAPSQHVKPVVIGGVDKHCLGGG